MLPARRLAGAGQRLRPPLRTASHPRSHTLTLPRALSHTHSPPSSSSVYLLQLSGDPGETQHCACVTPSPRPLGASQPAATLRRRRPGASRMARQGPSCTPSLPALGQRLLPAAPTNMLVGEPPRPIRFASHGTGSQWRAGKLGEALGHSGSRSFLPLRSSCGAGLPRPVAISYLDAPPTPAAA